MPQELGLRNERDDEFSHRNNADLYWRLTYTVRPGPDKDMLSVAMW
jgi:hypothetical protein